MSYNDQKVNKPLWVQQSIEISITIFIAFCYFLFEITCQPQLGIDHKSVMQSCVVPLNLGYVVLRFYVER